MDLGSLGRRSLGGTLILVGDARQKCVPTHAHCLFVCRSLSKDGTAQRDQSDQSDRKRKRRQQRGKKKRKRTGIDAESLIVDWEVSKVQDLQTGDRLERERSKDKGREDQEEGKNKGREDQGKRDLNSRPNTTVDEIRGNNLILDFACDLVDE